MIKLQMQGQQVGEVVKDTLSFQDKQELLELLVIQGIYIMKHQK